MDNNYLDVKAKKTEAFTRRNDTIGEYDAQYKNYGED